MADGTACAAGSPALCRFSILVLQCFGILPGGVVAPCCAALLAKLPRDLDLRIDVLAHLVLVEDGLEARLLVPRARTAVTRHAADACLGGAAGIAAVAAHAGTAARQALACVECGLFLFFRLGCALVACLEAHAAACAPAAGVIGDRKSTRLNSSHSQISYAVFCLKKKKNQPY